MRLLTESESFCLRFAVVPETKLTGLRIFILDSMSQNGPLICSSKFRTQYDVIILVSDAT